MKEDNLYLFFCYLIYVLTLMFLTKKSKNKIQVILSNVFILILYSGLFLYNLKYNSKGGSGLLWLVGLIFIIGIHWLINLVSLRSIFLKTKKTKSIASILALTSIILVATSCNSSSPASFWNDYKKEKIINNTSNQGPWGGKRIINWQDKEKFTLKETNAFARKNGWILIDSLIISDLTHINFDKFKNEYSEQLFKSTVLPKIKKRETIYIYKTGWIAVEPGNTDQTEENGFVTLNANKTKLSVYHIWGE